MIPKKGYKTLPHDPHLVGWFEADRVNGVNTALPSNNTNISNWLSVAGGGEKATRPTNITQPTFIENASNGKPAINFNSDSGGSAADHLDIVVHAGDDMGELDLYERTLNTDGMTVMACVKLDANIPPSGQSGHIVFCQSQNPNTNYQYGLFQQENGIAFSMTDGITGQTKTRARGGGVPTTPRVYSGWWDKADQSLNVQQGGEAVGTTPNIISAMSSNARYFAIGSQKESPVFNKRKLDGNIFAIYIYARKLSTQERDAVRNYLEVKYGAS